MRLPEQNLWDRMRKRPELAALRMWRMENVVAEGLGDVMTLHAGVVRFVELKALPEGWPGERAKVMTPSPMRLSQRNFHLEWQTFGGTSFILVGIGGGRDFELCMVNGVHADAVNGFRSDDLRANACARTWDAVAAFLRRPA